MRHWTVAAAIGLLWTTAASAQAFSSLESLPPRVRDGRVGLSTQDRVFTLGAELAVRNSDEQAKVLPQLKSALALGARALGHGRPHRSSSTNPGGFAPPRRSI